MKNNDYFIQKGNELYVVANLLKDFHNKVIKFFGTKEDKDKYSKYNTFLKKEHLDLRNMLISYVMIIFFKKSLKNQGKEEEFKDLIELIDVISQPIGRYFDGLYEGLNKAIDVFCDYAIVKGKYVFKTGLDFSDKATIIKFFAYVNFFTYFERTPFNPCLIPFSNIDLEYGFEKHIKDFRDNINPEIRKKFAIIDAILNENENNYLWWIGVYRSMNVLTEKEQEEYKKLYEDIIQQHNYAVQMWSRLLNIEEKLENT